MDDITQTQVIKNLLWNGPHAIIAWYASLLGYSWLGQGMGDPRVSALARRLIGEAVGPALVAENPHMADAVAGFSATFLERCNTSFKDPCARVGRDPLRKLQRNERIFRSIDLAKKHGIDSSALEYGTALALHYALGAIDSKDQECQQMRRLYQDSASIEAVLTWTGNYHGQPYSGLDPVTDAALIEAIAGHFHQIGQELRLSA